MMTIPLTNSKMVAFVDDFDFESLSQHRWQINPETGYVQRCVRANGSITTVLMAREIMGEPPLKVDHKDHNKLNNTRSNLRTATRSQNGGNRLKSRDCSSRFKGVHATKAGKFQSHIRHHGIKIHLGAFTNETEAALAYNSKAVEIFGEFALINEI